MRALFLDRDGVINRSPGLGEYVKSPEEFVFVDGIFVVLKEIAERGFRFFVVTNQRCIAREIVLPETLEEIHKKMLEGFEGKGIKIEKVYVCPHEEGTCDCRKPKPGMLLRAAEEFGIDLPASYMIGDNLTDVQAARAAGVRAILFASEGDDLNYGDALLMHSFGQLSAIVV